jgi:hypothetical protein
MYITLYFIKGQVTGCKMAATVQNLREILLTVEPPKILVDRATEIPILREDLLQRLKKATTREEAIAVSEEAKLDMVGITKTYGVLEK